MDDRTCMAFGEHEPIDVDPLGLATTGVDALPARASEHQVAKGHELELEALDEALSQDRS